MTAVHLVRVPASQCMTHVQEKGVVEGASEEGSRKENAGELFLNSVASLTTSQKGSTGDDTGRKYQVGQNTDQKGMSA